MCTVDLPAWSSGGLSLKSTPLNLMVSFTNSKSAFRFHEGINRARHELDGHKRNETMRNYYPKERKHASIKR